MAGSIFSDPAIVSDHVETSLKSRNIIPAKSARSLKALLPTRWFSPQSAMQCWRQQNITSCWYILDVFNSFRNSQRNSFFVCDKSMQANAKTQFWLALSPTCAIITTVRYKAGCSGHVTRCNWLSNVAKSRSLFNFFCNLLRNFSLHCKLQRRGVIRVISLQLASQWRCTAFCRENCLV